MLSLNSGSDISVSVPDYSREIDSIKESVEVLVGYFETYSNPYYNLLEMLNYQLFFISLLLIILVLRGRKK